MASAGDARRAGGWRDHLDRPTQAPQPPGADAAAFYAAIGDAQGAEYERNAFTRGTAHEVAVLVELLQLAAGALVLDVGCGTGRHLRQLARRGVRGVGIDVSGGLLAAGAVAARTEGSDDRVAFVRADARRLPLADAAVDAAISVCQGGLGTGRASDAAMLAELARVVRPGGRVALTLYHAVFAARHLVPGDAYDPAHGLLHHRAEVVAGGRTHTFDLWTSAYTVGEARLLLDAVGFEVEHVAGCEPGRFDATTVALDDPELLVVARRR